MHIIILKHLEETSTDVSPDSVQLSEEVLAEYIEHHFVTVVHIALCEHEIQYLASLVAQQVKLEAEAPMVPFPLVTKPENTLLRPRRRLWQTGIHVEPTNEMPVHSPMKHSLRKNAILTPARPIRVMKREYEGTAF